jgi:hypothetical protein
MDVTHAEISRAFLQVGFRTFKSATAKTSEYRIREIKNKSKAYVQRDAQGNLAMTQDFNDLESAEASTVSYYLGQSLTALFAERYLSCKWLFHVSKPGKSTINRHTKPMPLKRPIPNEHGIGNTPDLIGVAGTGQYHVLEAKCYRQFINRIYNKALYQLSWVQLINGRQPLTRVVNYFIHNGHNVKGIIHDPNDETSEAIDISFSEPNMMSDYYHFFSAHFNRKSGLDLYGLYLNEASKKADFILYDLGDSSFIGIQEPLLRFLQSDAKKDDPEFYNFVGEPSIMEVERIEANIRSRSDIVPALNQAGLENLYSLGIDGIIYIEIPNFRSSKQNVAELAFGQKVKRSIIKEMK